MTEHCVGMLTAIKTYSYCMIKLRKKYLFKLFWIRKSSKKYIKHTAERLRNLLTNLLYEWMRKKETF